MKLLFLLSTFLLLGINNCNNKNTESINVTHKNKNPTQTERVDQLANAYFASGCFWCVEAIFENVKGVNEVISGYSGGTTKNPTYRQVGYGGTGHAEVVEVQYNPNLINYETLVHVFYGSQDPTTYGQSPDFGEAYRSIIFYQNDNEKKIATNFKNKVQKKYTNKTVRTEIVPFQKFWIAENYHQNYKKLNPNYPYIIKVSIPRLNRFKEKFPELIKNEN